MRIKNPFRFSLTFLSLLVLLSTLFATNALSSGPDDAPTIISLENIGKPATKGTPNHAMLDAQNSPNAAANANIAIQQTVPITTARTMGDISATGEA